MTTEIYGVEQLEADLEAYTCPVHGCESALSGNVLMCRNHWGLVHADQKREVYECVRRLNRLAKRFDRSDRGTPKSNAIAGEYFEADDILREVQLRAVILASERSGCRAEPVDSASQSTPRKGGSMKIEVVNQDGTAKVTVTHGEEQLADTVTVEPGHSAEVRLSVDTPPPVEVSAPEPTPAPGDGSEPAAEGGAAPADGAAAGEGAAPADGAASPTGGGEAPAGGEETPA